MELNRAAAIAEAGDVEAALALVERLELDRYHYLHATRAELLRRLDRVDEARAAYDRALELVHSDAERRFLERRRRGASNVSATRVARILARVREIPEGFVRTYGDIDPGAPRLVGRVLSETDEDLPWHRVVRADGSLAKGSRQRRLLASRGSPAPRRPGGSPSGAPAAAHLA